MPRKIASIAQRSDRSGSYRLDESRKLLSLATLQTALEDDADRTAEQIPKINFGFR